MDAVQPISLLIDRIHGKSLREVFNSNPKMNHLGQDTRFLICIKEVRSPWRFWVKSPRYWVSIHRTQQNALNEVIKPALQSRRAGGKCFWATNDQILSGHLSDFGNFWDEYRGFLERRATANHADAMKGALFLINELMGVIYPEPN
jgi:hypothetical protein